MADTAPLPTDEDGFTITSAEFGQSVIVQIIWSTGPDHAPLDDEADYPSTFHGPFVDDDEAQDWMDSYPDDTEVHDMHTVPLNNVRPA